MAGTLAAAVAAPLPALTVPVLAPAIISTEPHPDQALLDAEAEFRRADAARDAAGRAASEARHAVTTALGPCPDALLATGWEWRHLLGTEPRPAGFIGLPLRLVTREGEDGVWFHAGSAWKATALRSAIEHAVPALGAGGMTPRRIRRWKSLLPIAADYDTREAELHARYRLDELRRAEKV